MPAQTSDPATDAALPLPRGCPAHPHECYDPPKSVSHHENAARRITLRRLRAADARLYRALRLRALKEHPDAFLISPQEEARQGAAETRARLRTSPTFGAFVDGDVAGMVGIHRETRVKARHKCVLWGMYVAPEFRGLGLGRALMLEALACARRMRGVEQVILAVGSTNRSARSLYRSVGFRRYGVEPRAMKLGRRTIDDEEMICFLTRRVSAR